MHDLTLARMENAEVERVVDAWRCENEQLGGRRAVNYVQIFENRGKMMGASNPHPHCQIWASHRIPNEIRKEQESQESWLGSRDRCLLCDYLALEKSSERVVTENEGFFAVVPFWAIWPFEILIIGRRHVSGLGGLTMEECAQLADMLKQVATRYDNLFESPCPYSMGLHQCPADDKSHEAWHLHVHFYPPILRSATIRKFMVGYELLAMPQRDITPEAAAARLRGLSARHYRHHGQSEQP